MLIYLKLSSFCKLKKFMCASESHLRSACQIHFREVLLSVNHLSFPTWSLHLSQQISSQPQTAYCSKVTKSPGLTEIWCKPDVSNISYQLEHSGLLQNYLHFGISTWSSRTWAANQMYPPPSAFDQLPSLPPNFSWKAVTEKSTPFLSLTEGWNIRSKRN